MKQRVTITILYKLKRETKAEFIIISHVSLLYSFVKNFKYDVTNIIYNYNNVKISLRY